MSAWGDAWSVLLGGEDEGDEFGGVTEIAKLDPWRVDAVRNPATGVATLLLKAIPGPRSAEDALEAMGYSTRPHRAGVVPRITPRVLKANAERQFSLHLAYPAWGVDTATALDGMRDTISPDELELGAWQFLKNGGQIGMFHEDGHAGPDVGRCVESYIWRAPPWKLTATDGSEQVIKAGDWMIGVQWESPAAWSAIKSGRCKGVSIQGDAIRRALTPAAIQGIRERRKGNG